MQIAEVTARRRVMRSHRHANDAYVSRRVAARSRGEHSARAAAVGIIMPCCGGHLLLQSVDNYLGRRALARCRASTTGSRSLSLGRQMTLLTLPR